MSATVDAPPAAFVAAVAAVVAADDSAGSIFLNASSLLGEAPKSCPSSFLSLCVICSLDSLVAGVKPELIEKHAYAHVLSLTVSYIAVRYANHPCALSVSLSLFQSLFSFRCAARNITSATLSPHACQRPQSFLRTIHLHYRLLGARLLSVKQLLSIFVSLIGLCWRPGALCFLFRLFRKLQSHHGQPS